MDEFLDEFYVTLPSNSSMDYFPENTQSSYRTKLFSPIALTGEWEVSLSEVFMPRSWFNVNSHNNSYSVTLEKEEILPLDNAKYNIALPDKVGENIEEFWSSINKEIEKKINADSPSVKFEMRDNGSALYIDIATGFEIMIEAASAPKLLYMLHLPNEDILITTSGVYQFRPSQLSLASNAFSIINKKPKNIINHILPFNRIKPRKSGDSNEDIFKILNANIELLELQDYLIIDYQPAKNEVEFRLSENVELHLSKENCISLMRKLDLKENCSLSYGSWKYKVNPLLQPVSGEYIELEIKEYYTTKKLVSYTENLTINRGMYKTADQLFKEFKYIQLEQQPDLRVRLNVPKNHEISFGKGLRDMLGFINNDPFKHGSYVSNYALEIDGGITEIYIYTDIIVSHNVGDTVSPLLRVIPCANEKEDQIVKHYDAPLYFPVRKKFIETIEIEIKSSSGDNIIFTHGKTLVVLSFRRKKL